MALWGNNDNVFSGGTVTLQYGTNRVVGTATSFGNAGSASVGDVISFGTPFDGPKNYHGDAVIVAIGSTLELTIDSTAGLSHGMIENVQYRITQSPKSATHDPNHNQMTNSAKFRTVKLATETNHARVGIGSTVIFVSGNPSGNNVAAGDIALFGFGDLPLGIASVVSVGATFVRVNASGISTQVLHYHAHGARAVGQSEVTVMDRYFNRRDNSVESIKVGDTFQVGLNTIGIGTIRKVSFLGVSEPNRKILVLDTPLVQAVGFRAEVKVERGIAVGTQIEFVGDETESGKEATVIGIAQTGASNASGTSYQLTSSGWVGITTYTDTHGNARVKKETLVAMSGITTSVAYPPA